MTYLPALSIGLSDRGLLKEDLAADINRHLRKPPLLSRRYKIVIVNGVTVIEDGKHTGERPGKALKKK